MKIIHAVMAGGIGSRLWPLSRKAYPKQFLKIVNGKSMLAETFCRYKNINFADNMVICNQSHKFLVKDALQEENIRADILLEPVGRNTAPAAVLAALHVIENHDDSLILLSPSDHIIDDLDNLEAMIVKGADLAKKGYIVTFGITPNAAETGYGYIKQDVALDSSEKIFSIQKFVEKPSTEKAKEYLESGAYLWNSGIYLFKASSMLEEMRSQRPEIVQICEQACKSSATKHPFYEVSPEIFEGCPEDSLDYAIMENTSKGAVVRVDVKWNDLGSWKSMWEYTKKDTAGNAKDGNVITINTTNSLIKSDNKHLIATIGIDNLAVIQTEDALLIANLDNSQEVKQLVKQLKVENRPQYIFHREVHRPWGQFDSIDSSERYQVKRITVNPGQKLSVQMHYHRAEHWIVVGGTALVRKGFDKDNLKEHLLRENESIYIEIGEIHSLENPGKFPLELIEVQSGAYLGEDDIVRFSDIYGRKK